MSRVAIILLHRGKDHAPSRNVLQHIKKSKVSGITEIQVRTDKLKEWLTHNSHNVEVNIFPSFLVAQEGERTQVYASNEVDIIIGIMKELTS